MESASPPNAFLIARSMLSLGMDSALARLIARRRRALAEGSGKPCFAAMVMSRESLENSLERFLSCAPLRNWMFLNLEWPAMDRFLFVALRASSQSAAQAPGQRPEAT